ncbi:MAG: hypothetical protein WCF67_06125 [Chitinophagaceae bacterium]
MNNRTGKNYDSDFCGTLPLHIINTIQPYGMLMVLDKTNLNIVQVSENIREALSMKPESVVNTAFGNYITSPVVSRLN